MCHVLLDLSTFVLLPHPCSVPVPRHVLPELRRPGHHSKEHSSCLVPPSSVAQPQPFELLVLLAVVFTHLSSMTRGILLKIEHEVMELLSAGKTLQGISLSSCGLRNEVLGLLPQRESNWL